MSGSAVLVGEALVRRHGSVEAVGGVTIEVARGELVALIGPSGCGKTTLLQMLGLLDRPTAGRVLVAGVDAWARSAPARADLRLSQLGFLFQERNLLDALSVRENVAMPAWRLGGSRASAFAAADLWLDRFGIAHRAHARGGTLSVGEAQRAALARALINRPGTLLCDEPTGSLDSVSAVSVLDALDEVRATGTAVLVATHDPAVAARADRVIAMRDGRLLD